MNCCKFLVGRNLVSSMGEGSPWDWAAPQGSPIAKAPKSKRRELMKMPTTEWLVYSPVKPVVISQRIGTENPPDELRGIVVDYDTRQTMDTVCTLLNEMPDKSLLPQYIDVSLSGKIHAIWVFEQPIKVAGMQHCSEILHELLELIGAPTLLAGYDMQGGVAVAEKPWVPITAGVDWYQINEKPFPQKAAIGAAIQVGKRTKLFSKTAVPLDKIAEEVEKRWPGKWVGTFQVGELGVRFWDSEADNTTGCQIKPDGMLCFTGPQAFVSWAELLGPVWFAMAKKFQLAEAIEGLYFDGKDYWEREGDEWRSITRVDIIMRLENRGISFSKAKGEATSNGNMVLEALQKQNYIGRVAPLVGYPEGLVIVDNIRTLNTARLHPTAAVPGPTQTEADFPFVWELFSGFFVTQPTDDKSTPAHTMLAWLKRARRSIVRHERLKGQAVFLCGPKNIGKTLFINGICKPMLGNVQRNPYKYFTGQMTWNDDLFKAGLLAINDEDAPSESEKPKFLAKIKSFVVNDEHDVHTRFKSSCQAYWYGRFMSSLNDDIGALGFLPEVCKNTVDKMHFMLCRHYRDFPADSEIRATLEKELPFFAHWLDNVYEPPKHVIEGGRCGVRSYFDPSLLAHATQQHFAYNLSELIDTWIGFAAIWGAPDYKDTWEGSPTALLSEFHSCEPIKEIAREWTTQKIVKALIGLAKTQDSGIEFLGEIGRDFRITKSVLLNYKK